MQQKNVVMSWPTLAQAGFIALLYFLMAQVSLLFVVQPEGIPAIWPAGGLLLAALLLNGKQRWPALLAAAFLAIAVANLLAGNSLASSLAFALANCSESLLAAYLLTRFFTGPITLTSLREVLGLVGLAAGLSNALTALLGAAVVSLAFGAPFWSAWQLWWIADGVGMLIITPVILTWAANPPPWKSFSPLRAGEMISLFVLLAITAQFIFGANPVTEAFVRPLPYIVLPFLIWAALRFDPRGVTTALLLLSLIAVSNVRLGLGPFAGAGASAKVHIFGAQLFISVMALVSLVLTAAIAESRRARTALQAAARELEMRVNERTAELSKINAVLQTEISERKLVETELRAGEERFRQVVLSISDHIYVTEITEAGHFVNRYLSPHVEALTGYPQEKFMSDWYFWSETVIHPDDRPLAAQQVARLAEGQNSEIEYRLARADGQVIWVRDSARVRRLDTSMQVYGVVSGITARKQIEEELQRYKEYLEELVTDRTAKLMLTNQQLAQEVVERERAEIALQTTLTKSEALYRIGQAAVLSESLSDLLQVVVDSVVEAVPANRAALITFSLDQQEVGYFIKSGPGSEQIVTVTFDELWQGLSGWVLRERQPALSPKGQPDQRESPVVQQRRVETNCGAIMVAPLLYRDHLMGTLTAINRPEERDFTPADVDLLVALANQAVIILEHKLAEETMQQSEAFLRSLFESAPDAIIVVDYQGSIVRANPQTRLTFGYSPDELHGQTLEILVPEPFRERHVAHRQNYRADFRTRSMGAGLELLGRRKDGSEFPVDIMLSPLGAAEDGLVIAVVRDITERKLAEKALREGEQRIFQIIEAMPIGVYVLDAAGRPYYANRVSQQLLGKGIVPGIELGQIAEVYQAYVAGTDQLYPAKRAPIARALAGESSTIDDVEIRQPGRVIALEVSATPIFNANGTIAYAIAVFQDITERKRAEEALRTSERRFRALIENGSDMVGLITAAGQMTYQSPSISRILGYTAEELIGRKIVELLHPDDMAEGIQRLARLVEAPETTTRYQYRIRHKNGDWRWVEVAAANLMTEPAVQAIVLNARDISERKRAEEASNKRTGSWPIKPPTSKPLMPSCRNMPPLFLTTCGRRCARSTITPIFWGRI